MKNVRNFLYWGLFMSLFSCQSPYTSKSLIEEDERTRREAVDIERHKTEIDKTVSLFKSVFSQYQQKEVYDSIYHLYSKDAFLNDRIATIKGRENIRFYFNESFEKIHDAKFTINSVCYGSKDAVFQWIMKIQLKNKGPWMDFLGVSIMRFDSKGMIIYQQDYWDYSELLSHIKGVKSLVNYIKSKS